MGLFNKKDEVEYLDQRLIRSQEEIDQLLEDNRKVRKQLIGERNKFFEDKQNLELEKEQFKIEKENIFKIAAMQTEHLTAELEFIKKHRLLPAECKWVKAGKNPMPTTMKRLK